jgi:hypothetical protein
MKRRIMISNKKRCSKIHLLNPFHGNGKSRPIFFWFLFLGNDHKFWENDVGCVGLEAVASCFCGIAFLGEKGEMKEGRREKK